MKYQIAPSILSADFSQLLEEIKKIKACGIEMIHIDVMDGHFVPNITIGPVVIKSLRDKTDLIFDTHLMIDYPQKYINNFIDAGSDIITVHFESRHDNILETFKMVKDRGALLGLTINPDTSIESIESFFPMLDMILIMSVYPGFGGQKFISDVLPKIKRARKIADLLGKEDFDIQVDGGINDQTIDLALKAGANIFVAGNYIFSCEDYKEPIGKLQDKIDKFIGA